jgi:uncharacterized protein (TIGR03437 family)
MPRSLAYIPVITLCAAGALAQPVVNAVANNYSYVLAGLPNYGIAQGSIFVIFGSNLAAASSGLQGVPLKTTLDGVSVQFSVPGATTQALLYYVMPNQIGGILPSATPAGTGTVVVTSGGQSSAPTPITVVQSAIGIAAGESVYGAAALAFDVNWKALGPSNAANAGDIVAFYGSGAGPVLGDESVPQTPQNLSNIPIEVDIGGTPAAVNYHGRSVYPGLDQFNVVIPAGAVGCSVSVVARSGDIVSNFAFIPIAAGSRTCSDQVPGITAPPAVVVTGKSSYNVANLNLSNNVVSNPATTVDGHVFPASILQNAFGGGQFLNFTLLGPGTLETGGGTPFPSIGECVTHPFTLPLPTPLPSQVAGPAAASPGPPSQLNAGPAINFTGPDGKASAPLQASQNGTYGGTLDATGTNSPPFIPSSGGLFTIDNGSGGPDVGPFTTQINVPPPLVWSNMNSITSIDRSQGLIITWTGGDPGGIVSIIGSSTITTPTQVVAVQLNCTAPVAAQQFTIPASVLLALPPQPLPTGSGFSPSLQVSGQNNFLFSAPGLDGGVINAAAENNLTVPYQ